MRRVLTTTLTSVVLTFALVTAASADVGQDLIQTGTSTEVSSPYLGGHAFAYAGSPAAQRGESLLPICFESAAAFDNHVVWKTRVDNGWDPEEALVGLPWPGIEPNDNGTLPRGCWGEAVQVVGEGLPCPEGEVPAVELVYGYDLPLVGSGGLGSFDISTRTDARRGGGDSGSFADPELCVEVWDGGGSDADDFVQIVFDPWFQKSPTVRGLTGLDTWVWYDFSNPLSHVVTDAATATLGPLTITLEAELWVDKVEWDLDGDGEYDVTLDLPDTPLESASHEQYVALGGSNSEDGNAGTFMYESIGTYATTTKATWRGVYRVTQITDGVDTAAYNGSPNLYDPIELAEVEDYDVISVRSELRSREG